MAQTTQAVGSSRTIDRRRWTIGLIVSEDCRWVRGAAVAAHGSGFEAKARVMCAAQSRIPRQSQRLFRDLADRRSRRSCALAGVLASELADVQAVVVQKLMARHPALCDSALCMAVHDPGLWCGVTADDRGYLSLCDAARLSELTGLSVIDALPARDLAQGGHGGPLLAAGYWVLLHHADRPRVIVHLGRTMRVTILPAARDASGVSRIAAFDVGPGMRLLDLVAVRVSADRRPDRHGHLAVQGCLREDFLQRWLAGPLVQAVEQTWHPHGTPQRRLADEIVKCVNTGAISGLDALCTATHLIATALVARLAGDLGTSAVPAEIVLTGPGRAHGLLLQQLGRRLPETKIVDEAEAGLPIGALDPAAVAMLGQFYLEQVPANQTTVSGARVPRVLGRLTPGAPQNWLRLVREMAKHQPVVALRTAI